MTMPRGSRGAKVNGESRVRDMLVLWFATNERTFLGTFMAIWAIPDNSDGQAGARPKKEA